MIERIAIIGTGLIGGSLGLAIKHARPSVHISGFDLPDRLDEAAFLGVLDSRAASLEAAVEDADLVILATPLPSIVSLLEEVSRVCRPDAVITDVGSVKTPVMERAREVVPEGMTFVGGHPMAGAASGGLKYADPLLFENAVYVLCPQGEALPLSFGTVRDLLSEIGARLLVMDAYHHDRIAAAVSHLPQLLSVALVEAAYETGRDEEAVGTLAAGGFRDMTRIADSPFELWRSILAANHGNVLDALSNMSSTIQKLRNRLIEEDYESIGRYFADAASRRKGIPRDMRGFLHPLFNVIVHAEDRPGWLADVTQTLAAKDLNIKDIELLKIREGTGGTFRLGFGSDGEMRDAMDVLRNAGYTVRNS